MFLVWCFIGTPNRENGSVSDALPVLGTLSSCWVAFSSLNMREGASYYCNLPCVVNIYGKPALSWREKRKDGWGWRWGREVAGEEGVKAPIYLDVSNSNIFFKWCVPPIPGYTE